MKGKSESFIRTEMSAQKRDIRGHIVPKDSNIYQSNKYYTSESIALGMCSFLHYSIIPLPSTLTLDYYSWIVDS
jgi:hypothetical protein